MGWNYERGRAGVRADGVRDQHLGWFSGVLAVRRSGYLRLAGRLGGRIFDGTAFEFLLNVDASFPCLPNRFGKSVPRHEGAIFY